MKQLNKFAAAGVLALFLFGLIIFTSSTGYAFGRRLWPDSEFWPVFGVLVLDVAMLTWLWVFLHYAEGAAQRLISVAGCLFGLLAIGVVLMAETALGSTIGGVGSDTVAIASVALPGLIVTHVTLGVLFHVTSPAARRAIATRSVLDRIEQRSFELLEQQSEQIAETVADSMAGDTLAELLHSVSKGEFIPTTAAVLPAAEFVQLASDTRPAAGLELVDKGNGSRKAYRRVCALDGCSQAFESTNGNAKYCNPSHRRKAAYQRQKVSR